MSRVAMRAESPSRRLVFAAACAVALAGPFAPSGGTTPLSGPRALATPASMFVSVLDKEGIPVPGLTAREFVIRENGARREVLRVVHPATEPIELTLVVDNTRVSGPHIQDLRAGVRAFAAAMHAKNLVSLVTFGDRPTVTVDYTHDLAKLDAGVGRLFAQPDSGSYLLDALVEACEGIAKRKPERAAIVAISVEGPEFGNTRYQQVLDAIAQSGASLSTLAVNPQRADLRDEAVMSRHMVMDRGPALSGGVRYDLLTSMGLAGRMTLVAQQLTNQYRVFYARPDTLIPPDTFEVSVTRTGLEAHGTPARRGTE